MEAIQHLTGHGSEVGEPAILGIVTVSDRASSGEYTDEGGPALLSFPKECTWYSTGELQVRSSPLDNAGNPPAGNVGRSKTFDELLFCLAPK